MASATPVNANEVMGPGGTVNSLNMDYNGTQIPMINPGTLDPSQINPAASPYLGQIQSMFSGLQGSMLGPDQYKHLQDTSEANLTTSLSNKYAAMGLSGSSAEMGGLNQAIQSNQMNWMNRQQGDYAKYLNAGEGLTKEGYGMTTGIQGGYGNFQDVYGQNILGLLGVGQGAANSSNQMIGSMVGGGFSGAGLAAGLLL